MVHLHQRSPPGDQTGVGLGVEPGRHGETGDGQTMGEISHRHEVVAQDVRHARSLLGVVLQQLLDEVLGQGPHPAGDVVLVLPDPGVGLLQGLGLEGRFAHQKGVEDTAEGPDIHLVTVTFLPQNLWGDVVGSPAQGFLPLAVVVDLGGQAKVSDLALHVIIEEDVSQLEVSVDDLVVVEVEDASQNVIHEVSGLWLGDCLPPLMKLHQTPAKDKISVKKNSRENKIPDVPFPTKFQDNVYKMIVLEVGEEFDQIHVGHGRVQPSNKILVYSGILRFLLPDLLSHLLFLVALQEEGLGHDLTRHDLPRDDILQLVALGESSLAQEPSSLVLPKQDRQ